jgi:hypothetical protein
MPRWRVHVSYWCGFTKGREWQEHARTAFATQGWSGIRFGNCRAPDYDYVPWSSGVDADEIDFVAQAESLDRQAIETVLKRVGIEHTAYVTIEQCQSEDSPDAEPGAAADPRRQSGSAG